MTATTKVLKTIEIKEITTQPQKQEVWVDEVVEVPNPELRLGEPFKVGEVLGCIEGYKYPVLNVGEFVKVVKDQKQRLVAVRTLTGSEEGWINHDWTASIFKRGKVVESYKQITQQEAIEMAINGKLDQVYNKGFTDWIAIPPENAASILSEPSYMFYVKETKYESIPDTIKLVNKVKKTITEDGGTKRHIVFVDGKEVGDLENMMFDNGAGVYRVKVMK